MDLFIATQAIKKFETFSARPKPDSGGRWQIGYGANFYMGETVTKETPAITIEEADLALAYMVRKLAREINSLLMNPCTENQMNALVIFVYNIGLGAFKGSSVLGAINTGASNDTIAADWAKWDKAHKNNGDVVTLTGLDSRRAEEIRIYFSDKEVATTEVK